jgi:hypothetical protein
VAVRATEGPNGGQGVAVGTVVVNAVPSAGFTISPTDPFAGDIVTFSSTSADSDGPIMSQDWDLDNDGQYDDASGAVVRGRFRSRGTYTVGLRVTDGRGASSVTSQAIRVRNRPLAALNVKVTMRGRLSGTLTQVTRLFVTAPRGSTVTVRCIAGSVAASAAPCKKFVKRSLKRRRQLRVKAAERQLPAGTKIEIRVSKRGYLTSVTRYALRAGDEPVRRDRCLTPGATKLKRCPE